MALYEIIQWPEIQVLMEKDGFQDNAYLINDEQGINEYGSLAYFVNKEWLDQSCKREQNSACESYAECSRLTHGSDKATDAPKQKVYIVSTLTESQDDASSDYHRVFANYFDAVHYKNGEVEECMCGKDTDQGEIINDFQTLYEWRLDSAAVTICIEEQILQ